MTRITRWAPHVETAVMGPCTRLTVGALFHDAHGHATVQALAGAGFALIEPHDSRC